MPPMFLLSLLVTFAVAEKDSNVYPWGNNPNTGFRMYWKDSSNILQDLENFQALYIKSHGCVWSECGVNAWDDDGEGDESDQWYADRTTNMCANAAFSLYGERKGTYHFSSCTKSSYINSFFTYGGADILADALGLSVSAYYDDGYYDDDHASGNSGCYSIQQDSGDSGSGDGDDGDDDGYVSSTMGCLASGKFVMANFKGQACEGANFFQSETDALKEYNRAMNAATTCTKIWDLSKDSLPTDDDYTAAGSIAETLLGQSWACDMDLYPNTCPDPYGKKTMYSTVMRGAEHGAPVGFAVANARLKRPLRFLSWLLLLVGLGLLGASYISRNKQRIRASGGGSRGLAKTVGDDLQEVAADSKRGLAAWIAKRRALLAKRARERQQQQQEEADGLERDYDGQDYDEHNDEYPDDPSLTYEEKKELKRQRKLERKAERKARRQARKEAEGRGEREYTERSPAELAI